MKFSCLALFLILAISASGQPQEGNATNKTVINESASMTLTHLMEDNASFVDEGASMDSAQPQGGICEASAYINLTFEVAEVNNNTNARFGFGKKEPAKQEMYKISIENNGDSRMADVIVTAQLTEDTKFESTRYYEDGRGQLDVKVDPPYFKKGTRTNLSWDLGTFGPEERKSILLEAYVKPNGNKLDVRVNVTGIYAGNLICAIKENATVAKCDYVNKNTGIECGVDLGAEECEIRCPAWSIPL